MSDTSRAPATGLSDRAAVAMLTLQLRTAQKELSDVRAEEASFDEQAARAELRTRLEPLEAERKAALEQALASAHAESTTAVDAARQRAAEIVAAARADAEAAAEAAAAAAVEAEVAAAEAAAADATEAEVVVMPPNETIAAAAAAPLIIDTTLAGEPALETEPDPVVAESPTEAPADAVTDAPPAEPVTTVSPVMPNVVIDAEAFARIFATVMAETIEKVRADSQPQGWPPAPGAPYPPGAPGAPGMPYAQQYGMQYGQYGQYPYYAPMPPPPKEGFWSHARHPDVILLGLATIIVLVIMVAWLS